MEAAFNILLATGDRETIQLVTGENPFAQVVFTNRQAELAILFDIGALSEIANTKSNLIGVIAIYCHHLLLFLNHSFVLDIQLSLHFLLHVWLFLDTFYISLNCLY